MIELKTYGGLSEEQLAALERELGIRLPLEYRRFLANTNGGRPVGMAGIAGTEYEMNTFLGVDPEQDWRDLASNASILAGRIPPGTLAVAHDSFGNSYLLSVSGPREGTVWFWDHEDESEEDEEPGWENISHVDDSFAAMLERLEPA